MCVYILPLYTYTHTQLCNYSSDMAYAGLPRHSTRIQMINSCCYESTDHACLIYLCLNTSVSIEPDIQGCSENIE